MEGLDLDTPKTIITEISGFVPMFDAVVEQYHDHTRAAVHGAVWRFCQMDDGVCKASLETIGSWIGVNKATVQRHMEVLVADGYFVDLTPELVNRPHVYTETGKVVMKGSLKAHVAQGNATVAQRNVGVAQGNAGVAQSRLNKEKDSKKDSKKGALTPEELAQANAKVDAMIEAGRKAKYVNRELIPEIYLPLCDVFVELTGLKPTKRVINDWIASFSDWLSEGIQPNHVRQAHAKANFTVTRPGSLTGVAAAEAARPASAKAPVIVRATEEDQKVTPPPEWFTQQAEQRRARMAAQS
ncbi:MAG TPA: hypothetical protein VIY48_01620 [Candidatus Paceibacterota bacterium]